MSTTVWPIKPLVGWYVLLRDGSEAVVVSVRTANDILRQLNELQAAAFGLGLRASYGHDWQRIYWEADVRVGDTEEVRRTVTPMLVERVLDKRL